MSAASRAVRPGQREHEIAACLALESEQRGMQAIVNLVATDERVFTFGILYPQINSWTNTRCLCFVAGSGV